MALSPHSSVGASKRMEWLLEQLSQHGEVKTRGAARHWGCSVETIRKDLLALESQGLARRAHGGALPVGPLQPELPLVERTANADQKNRIAQAALAELEPGSTVFLESGSTTGLLASLIPAHYRLSVVTNSLPIAQTLMAMPLIDTHLVGGTIRPLTHATAGYWALRELSDVAVDTAVLGTNAISPSGELSTPDADEATIKAAALGLGARRILLADHSKFDTRALHRYGTLADVNLVITDTLGANALASVTTQAPETRIA